MVFHSAFWRQGVFRLVAIACVLFVLLTAVAMLFYPGGTASNPTTSGYSFFTNFFSDLGLTQTRTGQPNTASAILFVTALTLAGAALAVFFIVFAQFFAHSTAGKILSGLGALCGVFAGLCFIGVAFTPANLATKAHIQFVLWAFEAFPIAALFYTAAILQERKYPKRFALVFGAFTILLVLYLGLMMRGPSFGTSQGLLIQATGQKVIVYASIISILIQSLGARQVAKSR
jgi:hypothetical protein